MGHRMHTLYPQGYSPPQPTPVSASAFLGNMHALRAEQAADVGADAQLTVPIGSAWCRTLCPFPFAVVNVAVPGAVVAALGAGDPPKHRMCGERHRRQNYRRRRTELPGCDEGQRSSDQERQDRSASDWEVREVTAPSPVMINCSLGRLRPVRVEGAVQVRASRTETPRLSDQDTASDDDEDPREHAVTEEGKDAEGQECGQDYPSHYRARDHAASAPPRRAP